MPTRPTRVYLHTFSRVEEPLHLRPLTIVQAGITPCAARRRAFDELERRIRREQLPAQGWKLIKQQYLPRTGSTVTL